MTKYLCFRFDVDTHVCIREGVPKILSLFKTYNARCTFFVNMGSAFDRNLLFKERFEKLFSKANNEIGILPMFTKLGFKNSVEALLLNPKVGSAYPHILHEIVRSGHELGLHGGENHAKWETNALQWSHARINQEIAIGLGFFKKFNLPDPVSFASPCWQSPNDLSTLLKQHGFLILADSHNNAESPRLDANGILLYPTNITGKQSSVGFIENFRALGYSTQEIVEEFEKQLDQNGNLQMIFDHPLYAGVKELQILAKMIDVAVRKGYQLESLQNISKTLIR